MPIPDPNLEKNIFLIGYSKLTAFSGATLSQAIFAARIFAETKRLTVTFFVTT